MIEEGNIRMYKDEKVYNQGKNFEQNKGTDERKAKGVFYTPFVIVEYMVESVLSNCELWNNPYIRVLDPSCGAGYFLLKAIEVLENQFKNNAQEIINKNLELKQVLLNGNIKKFIAENLIWGADIDPEAVKLTENSINELVGEKCDLNIICCDSLTSGVDTLISDVDTKDNNINAFWHQQYNYILGNPPYIGHKGVDNSYKTVLHGIYGEVYRDKSDILYCFIKKSIDLLPIEGTMSFICSRYFIEGPSAVLLRKYITDNCTIVEIVDFQGCEVFEDAGVAACIITLKKENKTSGTEIIKILDYTPVLKLEQQHRQSFTVDNNMLKPAGWLLITPEQYEIYKIIEQKGTHELKELMDSYQGIITGCDKAFVVSTEEIDKYQLEGDLLRPWIKNKNIIRNKIEPSQLYLIYADQIKNENEYPNSIKYISQYKEKLIQRRECKKGTREWYKLQWGRKCTVFDSKKLVYPYKSSTNRFAIDEIGYYCSADVYSLITKNKYSELLNYNYISAILNSKIIEFYFKCFAKKLSDRLYDYYPNTVLKIKIIADEISQQIGQLSEEIGKCTKKEDINCISLAIDRELYKTYGLTETQIAIIETSLIK